MDTKEAIEFLEKDFKRAENVFRNFCMPLIENGKQEIAKLTKKHEGIIDLLKRGEKYNAILKEIEYNLDWHKPDSPFSSPDGELIDEIFGLINDIKQKYFPKGGSQ